MEIKQIGFDFENKTGCNHVIGTINGEPITQSDYIQNNNNFILGEINDVCITCGCGFLNTYPVFTDTEVIKKQKKVFLFQPVGEPVCLGSYGNPDKTPDLERICNGCAFEIKCIEKCIDKFKKIECFGTYFDENKDIDDDIDYESWSDDDWKKDDENICKICNKCLKCELQIPCYKFSTYGKTK